MLSFGTGFALGLYFRDGVSKDLHRELFPDGGDDWWDDWWDFHISNLYDDLENECIKKWATAKGYDIKTQEHIIRALIHSYKVRAEILAIMFECAKEKKKEAKNSCKKEEAKFLIRKIKRYQKRLRRHMK